MDAEADVSVSLGASTSALGGITVHHNAQVLPSGLSATGGVGSLSTVCKANVSPTLDAANSVLATAFVAWHDPDEDQTPNWADINQDQTPNWTDVAA